MAFLYSSGFVWSRIENVGGRAVYWFKQEQDGTPFKNVSAAMGAYTDFRNKSREECEALGIQ